MTLELTIVVPVFNEAHRLAEGMKRFGAAVADGAVDIQRTEVLVIDDGSTDQTAATARSLVTQLPHHRVVSLPSNQGKGAAVRTGVSMARGTCTAYMDADMAIDPRAIPLLVDGLRANDVAIGSRALADSMVESTYVMRSVMGGLFNRLVTTGTGLDLHDTQCGFKAFRTPAARLLFHLVRIDRFAFDVEVLARARRLGLRITEVPVQWRHVPGSTIHPLHDSITMLTDVYRSRLGLLATPPVPSVIVRDRSDTTDPVVLAERVRSVVAGSSEGLPLPVVADGPSVIVLLPLIDPADVVVIVSALRAEFESLTVSRRAMTVDALERLGPLSGRLEAPLDRGGMP
jgi:glycosyltransferase involved in cell wall biosynthesis